MRRLRMGIKLGSLLALTLGLVLAGGFALRPGRSPVASTDPSALAAGMVGAPKLRAAYASWAAAHEQAGGDRRVEIPLGRTDVHVRGADSEEGALGVVTLDLIAGRVESRLPSLPPNPQGYVLWLVDNPAGAENGMNPDAEDRYIEVGRLEQSGSGWALSADLGPEAFARFGVDAAVVVPAGTDPSAKALMAGAPDLFQRIYSALRTPDLFVASDYAALVTEEPPGLDLGVRSALAARKPNPERFIVDVDVLFNRLVARGADLFINETFGGNGRTCSTCHTLKNNTTLDPTFIASLPDTDPLFITEQIPELASDGTKVGALDVPQILRATGLVGLPGPDTVANPAINRAVTHLRGLNFTVRPPAPVVVPFGPGNPAPFVLPDPPPPGVVMGITIDNATVPGFERAGFGGDLALVPSMGRFGRARDAVPGATALLLTRTLNRVPGVDFRFPTDLETDAISAFFFSLGRSADLDLPIPLSDPIARRGQAVFMNDGGALNGAPPGSAQVIPVTDEFGNPIGAGKCNICHFNAGALTKPDVFAGVEPAFAQMLGIPRDQFPSLGLRNMNFETGVERLPSQPANVVAADRKGRDAGFGLIPHDPAAGACTNGRGGLGAVTMFPFPGANPPDQIGDCIEEFNTQSLVEAADTGPFFHNNAVATIEMAVEFYNTDAFNNSAGARVLGAVTGTNGIRLEATEVQAIASFLRAINALDNVQEAIENVGTSLRVRGNSDARNAIRRELIDNALLAIDDAVEVLSGAGVNTLAVDELRDARASLLRARDDSGSFLARLLRALGLRGRRSDTRLAVQSLVRARNGISPPQR